MDGTGTRYTCNISGESFNVAEPELVLRKRLSAPNPSIKPRYRYQQLLAFWQHFGLHRRKCDHTGKSLISVYDSSCPFPVWERSIWLEQANPPQAEYNFNSNFFDQLYSLASACPIPHNTCLGNENCEYTDDWWYSKNCYLCHSGLSNEDSTYCYRLYKSKDCQYCVFTSESELCSDCVNIRNCFSLVAGINCRNCIDSAFLFDCRNCNNCLLCWNLRNKEFCYRNKQLTKEEYLKVKEAYNLTSRSFYNQVFAEFKQIIYSQAYWRALENDKCQDVTGAYIENSKNSLDCYFASDLEDCAHFIRGINLKSSIDCICCFNSELVYYSSMAQDNCYDIRFCNNVFKSKHLEYCGFCYNCTDCFACWGLVNQKYCIFNKQYTKPEYLQLKDYIIKAMKANDEYEQFFPNKFVPHFYDESLAGFYFPLTIAEQVAAGFRVNRDATKMRKNELDRLTIPDFSLDVEQSIQKNIYWDEVESRPFQITSFDLAFAKRNKTPLPDRFYVRRIKELFSHMYFDGYLRETKCAHSNITILTNLPENLDGRILSEESYLKLIH